VWEGGGGRGRKRVRWSWWGCVKRFCAVPLREHVKFSRATSVFSVVWHVARSETASRALVSSAGFSTKTRRGFPESRWQQNQVSLVLSFGPRGCLGKDDAGSRPRRLRGHAVE
jgi:hypothetical protein